MNNNVLICGAALLALVSIGATNITVANDEDFELWLNPAVSGDFDDNTSWELGTAQRFRDESDGREDTYFARFWINQKLNDAVTIQGALERRINDGAAEETRVMQQMSTRHGIFRTRLRFEQRFVDHADQTGLRLRPRLGLAIPITDDERWSFRADAELFWTLRSTSDGGDDGLTGLRTQIGISYDATDALSISAAYLRQQDFEDGAPDIIGHAPIISIEYAL